MLGLIADFAREGLIFDSALNLCPGLLVPHGILDSPPSAAPREQADIAFGWEVAKKMGDLDVGQSVAVKEGGVLAVEADRGHRDLRDRPAGAVPGRRLRGHQGRQRGPTPCFDVPSSG